MCLAKIAKITECDLYVTLKFAGYARGRQRSWWRIAAKIGECEQNVQ